MNKPHTTREEINHIVEAYKSGMKIKDIAENTGKARQTILNILDREGVRPIMGKDALSTLTKVSDVICPNCRAKGHYKGAKFCYKCGADVRTESDILRERLGKLVGDFSFLPESIRDNAYAVVQDTIDYLRKV
jgi:hypothetical protein